MFLIISIKLSDENLLCAKLLPRRRRQRPSKLASCSVKTELSDGRGATESLFLGTQVTCGAAASAVGTSALRDFDEGFSMGAIALSGSFRIMVIYMIAAAAQTLRQ